jgi:hypothetical protein
VIALWKSLLSLLITAKCVLQEYIATWIWIVMCTYSHKELKCHQYTYKSGRNAGPTRHFLEETPTIRKHMRIPATRKNSKIALSNTSDRKSRKGLRIAGPQCHPQRGYKYGSGKHESSDVKAASTQYVVIYRVSCPVFNILTEFTPTNYILPIDKLKEVLQIIIRKIQLP